jgi:AraC-like DNA-binding protein
LTACLGTNFSLLKRQLNCDCIQRMLTDGQVRSVKQAALDSGYGSSAALAKRTNKIFGLSPTAIRRQGRK